MGTDVLWSTNTSKSRCVACPAHVGVQHLYDTYDTFWESQQVSEKLDKCLQKNGIFLWFDTLWIIIRHSYDTLTTYMVKKVFHKKKIVFLCFNTPYTLHLTHLKGLNVYWKFETMLSMKNINFNFNIFNSLNNKWINETQILSYIAVSESYIFYIIDIGVSMSVSVLHRVSLRGWVHVMWWCGLSFGNGIDYE